MNGERTEPSAPGPVSASGIASGAGMVGNALDGRTADSPVPPSLQGAYGQATTPGADATTAQPGQAGNFAQPAATPGEPAAPAQQQLGQGAVVTLQRNVRRGGRPDMRGAQAEAASASALRGAAQDIGQTGQAIGALSRAQAAASFEGVRDAEALQQSNRDEQQEQRAEVDRSYNRYVGALREVDEMQEVDPGRVWARMDTATRIIAGIGMGMQAGARMWGRPLENGPIERMAEVVQRDLEIQRENYTRARVSARGQQNLYGIMRERFQDDRAADDLAEAAAWTLVQRRIETYGRQIQNQGARTRLSSLAAQVAERSNAATVRGLQAQRLARRRARGSTSYTMGIMTPQGMQLVNMTGRQRTAHLLSSAQRSQAAQAQANDAVVSAMLAREGQEISQNRSAALQEWRRRRNVIPSANNLNVTMGLLRDLGEDAQRQGLTMGDADTAPFGLLNIMAGPGGRRQALVSLFATDRGRQLRQRLTQDVFNYVLRQSGAQVTDEEFKRRMATMTEALQTTEGMVEGLRMMTEDNIGAFNHIRGLSVPTYNRLWRDAGFEIDPRDTLNRTASALGRDMGYEAGGVRDIATTIIRDFGAGGDHDTSNED